MKKIIKASFFQKIVLPAMLAILLFLISVFAFIIPAFENNAIEQKRIMLHELTNTAWSILQKYHHDEVNGIISLQEAQAKAISEIEALRYGPDKKDYFWITDLEPAMIMHPYVHELTGQSLHDYTDPDGKKLFIEALKIAQEHGEGFISYKWQFKDDSTHIVPKLSFVKSFQAWDWIIGTGIYLHDVQLEISELTNKLILILLGITFIIGLIIFFITYQSLNIETRRRLVEEQLHESREKYRSLLESSTEGIMLLLNGKISYSNNYIQKWLQYSDDELGVLPLDKLINTNQHVDFESVNIETRLEVHLVRKDGSSTEAVLTILPVRFAGKEGLLLTFRDTQEHRAVKSELDDFRQRFKHVSQYSKIGLFRFSLTGKRLMEFNQNVVAMLGYDSMSELKKIPLVHILPSKTALRELLVEVREKGIVEDRKIQLRKKNNSLHEFRLCLSLSETNVGETIYCDGIIEPYQSAMISENANGFSQKLYELISHGHHRAIDHCRPLIGCPGDAQIKQAVEIMKRHKSDFVLIMINQKPTGILTHGDIITRFLNERIVYESPVTEFMTSPLVYIDENTSLVNASVILNEKNISHAVLRNSNGDAVGVFCKHDLFGYTINPSESLLKAIESATTIGALRTHRQQLPMLIKPLLNEMGSTQTINKIISGFNDAITSRIIELAISEIGQPPVPFSFVVIGSAGREELVFNSDQDNAIIFEDNDTIPTESIQSYFLELGEKICKRLDESGLHSCPGDYMASNPKWCQPLSAWQKYFTEWIVNAEPENILDISVFFDLRLAFGDHTLFSSLEDHVFKTLKGKSAFFYFLAQSVSSFKPPLNVFGNIVTETSGKNTETIDVKTCIAMVVMFTRIYALHHGIRPKDTISRIQALLKAQVLSPTTAAEVNFHYNFLTQQRLSQQLRQISKKSEITNAVLPKQMTEMEQMILKKVFSQMSGYQEKLGAEFMSAFKG